MSDKILLCTDLDRTLLPNGKQPESPNARPLFTQFCQHPQVVLVYVSGRDRRLLLEAIEEYDIPIPDYAIGDVGTSIYHIEQNHWQLDEEWSRLLEADWQGNSRETLQGMLSPVEELILQEAEKQNTYKLSYYLPLDLDSRSIIQRMQTILSDAELHSNIIWSVDEPKHIGLIDVLPRAANKLEAIRFLSRTLAIPLERTVFAGDSGNDLSVLTSEIPSVLVANANDEVRQEALRLASQHASSEQLYLARGGLFGLNGNYSAGILEGVYHYIADSREWLAVLAK